MIKEKSCKLLVILSCMALLAACSQKENTVTDQLIDASQNETAVAQQPSAEADEKESRDYDTSQQYDAVVLKDGDSITAGSYYASGDDESVIEISGNNTAEVTGSLINKTDGKATSANDASFKGVNSAVRAYGNSQLTLNDCVINSDGENATGVFAYDGATIYISDSEVTVTGGGAGGIQVAGGGTLYASNLNVISSSKAAIRSDRGGGILMVEGGSYTSLGSNGCPAIYSTADITVKDAVCVSENSRAVIIEGKNSVTLENCELSGNDQSTKQGSIKANVLLYQSASGDAAEGTSEFTMSGGKITSNSGAMFYCTNTSSIINLNDAELVLSDDGSLLIVSQGRWGKEGKNGGNCTFNCEDQLIEGTVTVDEISSLTMNLINTEFIGSVNSSGSTAVVMDSGSSWTLTADSYISSFDGDLDNVDTNGYKLYVDGTLVK